jgi:hypothetical protein
VTNGYSVGAVPLNVKGMAGQTANLAEFKNSAGTALTVVSSAGSVGIGTTSPGTALDLNGALTVRGMAAPAVSAAGQGRIYFDSTSNTFQVSQNGGGYAPLVAGSSTGNYLFSGNTLTTATGDPITVVPGAAATVSSNGNTTTRRRSYFNNSWYTDKRQRRRCDCFFNRGHWWLLR